MDQETKSPEDNSIIGMLDHDPTPVINFIFPYSLKRESGYVVEFQSHYM